MENGVDKKYRYGLGDVYSRVKCYFIGKFWWRDWGLYKEEFFNKNGTGFFAVGKG